MNNSQQMPTESRNDLDLSFIENSSAVVIDDIDHSNQGQDNVELHHEDESNFIDDEEFKLDDCPPSDRNGKRPRDIDEEERMDKRDNTFSVAAPKRARNGGRGDDKIELRILIPVNTAGALIGKGGSNIRELRAEFKASIQIPDSNGFERVVTAVTSSIDDLAMFAGKASRCLNERTRPRDECSIRILIHKSQAGTIIGIKGTRIKELRETTGAKIKVNQECCPGSTDRICQITGANDILVKCVRSVLELLQSAPPKGHIENYNPSICDDSYNYGGFNGFEGDFPFEHGMRRRPGLPMRDPGFEPMPPFRNRGRGRYPDEFEDFGRRRMNGNPAGPMGGGRMRYPPDRPMRRGPRMAGPGPMRRPGRFSCHYEEDNFGEFEDDFPPHPPHHHRMDAGVSSMMPSTVSYFL